MRIRNKLNNMSAISHNIKEKNRIIHNENLNICFGSYQLTQSIVIVCPNDKNHEQCHHLVKNGFDKKYNPPKQKYLCKTCGKSCFAETSGFFRSFLDELIDIFKSAFSGGKLNSSRLQHFRDLSKSQCALILEKVLNEVENNSKIRKIHEKHRNSNMLFVDETFITIQGKTWYLVVVISGNNKIMGFRLVSKREKKIILELIRNCSKRLNYGFKVLVTDGFKVYTGVAQDLDIPLIHIRHIHEPPYRRITIDTITHSNSRITTIRAETTNEIMMYDGYFLAMVSERIKEKHTKGKRGRKAGGKNRPKKVIEIEKQRKAKRKGIIGRPKGSKEMRKKKDLQIFWMDKKAECIFPIGGASQEVAMSATTICQQFKEKHITSNLVEKEFSVLKKLLGERGKRSINRWIKLLNAYFTIRDEPKILGKILKSIKIPAQWGKYGLLQKIQISVCV